MNKLRRLHTFLGCFFAPLLLFFICTGWYQTVNPDRRKSPDEAEAIADRARAVHADSLLPNATASGYATKPFRYLVVAMSAAITTVLGLILAFRFSKNKWAVAISLTLGLVIPVLLLVLGQKR